MKFILIVIILISMASCDAPRQRGLSYNNTNSALTYEVETTTTSSSSTATTSSVPADAKHCNFITATGTFRATNAHVGGGFLACQSSTNPALIYVQFQVASPDVQICFFPATTENNQFLGNPTCGYIPKARTVYGFKLVKDRENFEEANLNAVYIAKDSSFYYPYPFNGTYKASTALHMCFNALIKGNSTYCSTVGTMGKFLFTKLLVPTTETSFNI